MIKENYPTKKQFIEILQKAGASGFFSELALHYYEELYSDAFKENQETIFGMPVFETKLPEVAAAVEKTQGKPIMTIGTWCGPKCLDVAACHACCRCAKHCKCFKIDHIET